MEFCEQYGVYVRVEHPYPQAAGPELQRVARAEALRRKLRFDDKSVQERSVRIGMTECQMVAALGYPERENRTIVPGAIKTQNVYGRLYVYTAGNRIVAIQD